jgi:mannitol-1-/sugar-/sorbitol-6-phosphatase
MEFAADAVLLDLDGTLVDSTEAVVRCWLRWAEEFGVDPMRLNGSHGRPTAEIVASVLPALRVPEALARIDHLELTDVAGVRALPGAVELITALPAGSWAIVTSCGHDLAMARMGAAGLPPVPVLVTADDVTNGKPAPEPYLTGAARLGADPARGLVVEDAPSGVAAARAAGMRVVGVATTHRPEALAADIVVDSPARLEVAGGAPLVIAAGSADAE